MRIGMLKIMAWLLLIIGGFAACNSDDPWPYTEDFYAPYLWDLDYEGYGNVILVNSDEELEQYFIGTDYPVINFSNQSLLLVSGTGTSNIVEKTITNFQKLSNEKYKLDVKLVLSVFAVMEPYIIAVFTDKISDNSKIKLNVSIVDIPMLD